MRSRACGGAWLVAVAIPAVATAHGGPHSPEDFRFWSEWSARPGVTVPLVVTTLVYALGLYNCWRRAGIGQGIGLRQAGLFGAGLLTLVAALMSPLDAITASLFSLHMVQHLTLILVAAPLLVLGRPEIALLFAVPRAWRPGIGRFENRAARAVAGDSDGAGVGPILVILVGTGVLWAWHAPLLYELAARNDAVHTAEHTGFVLTAVLFWATVLRLRTREALGHGLRILYVFAMALQGSVLGALITFAGHPLYTTYAAATRAWGYDPLVDQQLAGLIMWVPPAALYLGVAAYLFVRWLAAVGEARSRSESLEDQRKERDDDDQSDQKDDSGGASQELQHGSLLVGRKVSPYERAPSSMPLTR